MEHVREQIGVPQELATAPRLGFAGGRQTDVHPSGEQVLRIPLALAVTEQHQRRHEASVLSPLDAKICHPAVHSAAKFVAQVCTRRQACSRLCGRWPVAWCTTRRAIDTAWSANRS